MAEKEYIERRTLMEDARHDKAIIANLAGITDIANLINDQPTADVVEVVRCKDCEYCDKSCSYGLQCRHPDGLNSFVCETEYCSRGAKMDGKGEGE